MSFLWFLVQKLEKMVFFSDSGLSKALRVSANELHVSAQQDTHIHSSDHVRLGKVMVSGGKFNLETLKSANITVTDDISALGILLETSGSLIVGGALDDGGKGLELRFGKRFSVSQDFKASTLLIGLAKVHRTRDCHCLIKPHHHLMGTLRLVRFWLIGAMQQTLNLLLNHNAI